MKAVRDYSSTNFPAWILPTVKKIHENFDALSEKDVVIRKSNAVMSAVSSHFKGVGTVLEVAETAGKDPFSTKNVLKRFRKSWNARRSRWMRDTESDAALDMIVFSASMEILNMPGAA